MNKGSTSLFDVIFTCERRIFKSGVLLRNF